MEKEKEVKIRGDYITLGQLLKEEGLIQTGGAAKYFLRENEVQVNGQVDTRRGKKLRAGDEVIVPNHGKLLIK
ncbi:MAG: S4 domain-containing protein YaaA [[Lactobacillus] timonensis]|jgi:ribosome-associated protein|uniref:S4 domain-containing protein YaaA n=1 Tax=[Lactobacillus] timonensis TaxID=1970790 RepID=UPI000C865248|nr:S4 domain-containing protein YaaA [[Lactobacillus] timonensis]MCI1287027.1 S4 domain-containing protein YaaA [[Lactobacillus] timonensis]MCI1925495.1 S4 domain-containing protein YaaA [[Lactobacillus] timonensis]MCI1956753.1 S4 domain-containing protein YaaA [[Lactobacillus] timonensis]MCI1969743.1 S4 domain-containing protein YaaA [[Lactobacillus] timonensis]MCI2006044.1 S4 domain-containing protein YaaA [[Lactobacillus] timonensis]